MRSGTIAIESAKERANRSSTSISLSRKNALVRKYPGRKRMKIDPADIRRICTARRSWYGMSIPERVMSATRTVILGRMSVLPENFIDNRVWEIGKYGMKTLRWKLEWWLEISDKDVEFWCDFFVILDHLALFSGCRVSIKSIPCRLIPYLVAKQSGSECTHLTIAENPRSIELVCDKHGGIFWDEYIKILHNIKLFLSDSVPILIGCYMRDIEISLNREKKHDNHMSEPSREFTPDSYHCIWSHENRKYIKEDKHAIVEKQSCDRPDESEEESGKYYVIFSPIQFAVNSRDEYEKVGKYEDEELSWSKKCSRWCHPTKCRRKWSHHVREYSELSRIEWQCDESAQKDKSDIFPRDFARLKGLSDEYYSQNNHEVECRSSVDTTESCNRQDKKGWLFVKKGERNDDEDNPYDIPPVVPPEFLVLYDRYEEYTGRNKSKWATQTLFAKGIECTCGEYRKKSKKRPDNLIGSISDKGEKHCEDRKKWLMIRERWIWWTWKSRKCMESLFYRIAKKSWIISIRYFVYRISPDTIDSESKTDCKEDEKEFFWNSAHSFSSKSICEWDILANNPLISSVWCYRVWQQLQLMHWVTLRDLHEG